LSISAIYFQPFLAIFGLPLTKPPFLYPKKSFTLFKVGFLENSFIFVKVLSFIGFGFFPVAFLTPTSAALILPSLSFALTPWSFKILIAFLVASLPAYCCSYYGPGIIFLLIYY
jgi:hypothetical protein